MTRALAQRDVERQLNDRSGWRYDADKRALCRDFSFGDFAEAFAFMTRVAAYAEKAGHHPDWSNSYNLVSVCLSTHSEGGVTDKDFALASAMDMMFDN